MKSLYEQDYYNFCQLNSFKLDSPFSRSQYRKRVKVANKYNKVSALSNKTNTKNTSPNEAKFFNGLNFGHHDYYCVMCDCYFSGERLCPCCNHHIYLAGKENERT